MISAGKPSSKPRRSPVSDWYVFFLDLGFLLLIFGFAVLFTAVLPNISPPVRVGLIALSALILLPIRRGLLGQIEKTPVRDFEKSLRRRQAGASESPSAPGDPVADFLRRIQEKFSPAHIHLYQPQNDGKTFAASTTEVDFSANGDLAQNLSSGTETRLIGAEPPTDLFGDRARLFTLGARAVVALRKGGRLAGFLVLGPQANGRNYTAEDLSQLRSWAARATAAPAREIHASADPRDALLTILRIIHSVADLDVLLELLQSQTFRLIPAQSFRIALAGDASTALSYVFYSEDGARRKAREGVPFPADEDLAGEVVRTGQTVQTADYGEACRIRNLPQREKTGAWAGVALTTGATVIGAMILLRDEPFQTADDFVLESIAAHAGPAISRLLLERQSIRRTELLETLVRASRRIAGAQDDRTLTAVLLSSARELFPCQAAFLLLPDSCGDWVVDRQDGLADEPNSLLSLRADHPLTRSTPGDHPNYLSFLPDEDPLRQAMLERGMAFHRAASIPLRRKEKLIGWIVLWNPAENTAFRADEETILQQYAATAVTALSAASGEGKTGVRSSAIAEELASLQNLDRELNNASDRHQAIGITLDWAVRYTESSAGVALDLDGDHCEVSAVRGYPESLAPEIGSVFPSTFAGLTDAVRSGRAVLRMVDDTPSAGLLPGGKSALLVPVRRNAQTMGMLLLESESANAFPPGQIEFLEQLASHAAIAISNAQLYSEVRNADQAKSEFISFVAHELKTPMTSIRGYTDLLAQGAVGPVTQPQANFLSTIRLNADRMAALVSDLNDISRIETGRLKLEFAAVALAPALEEVIDGLRSQIESKEQKLTLEIPSDLPPVWVDRGRLIQILTNLVSNAQKYTLSGGAFRISAERSPNRWDPSGPPEVVHILVEDTGLGISPQEQKSIFQKFFRSEDRIVRDLPGTGLGLNITRNLVEMHGGKIWFESELHKGSTFHFTIPVSSV